MTLSTRLLSCLLFLICFSSSANAQWTKIGDRLLGLRMGVGSAITFIDGHIWAGHRKLWLTTDNGGTWTDRTPASMDSFTNILDIEFFDRDHGSFVAIGLCGILEGCEEDAHFTTTDGGISWTKRQVPRATTVSYMGSSQALVVGGSKVETTLDGGATWRSQDVRGELAASSVYFGEGKAGIFVWGRNRTSYLYFTNNFGDFWDRQRDFIDYDCYDMVYDSCSNTLFVVNEEWLVKEDNAASAIISSDMGTSWNTVCSFPYASNTEHSINGAVDITSSAWYLQTGTQGIIRSTDRGSSWRTLGGPNGPIDTRGIVVPRDNLIYAIDEDGSIWMTENAGGRPIITPSTSSLVTLSRDELFTDSVARACGQPIVDQLLLATNICGSVAINDIQIIGEDSVMYEILDAPVGEINTSDRISVAFSPTRNGHYSASMRITYLDGSEQIIQLRGTADLNLIPVNASLSNVEIDTLGEHASMDLFIDPSDLTDDVSVQITYDPDLHYEGTYAYDGTPLHVLPVNGTAQFVIPGDKLQVSNPDAVIRFSNVTAVPKARYQVTIDSLSVSTLSKGCYSTLGMESGDMTVLVECGTITLSHVLRNELITFKVYEGRGREELIVKSSHEGQYTISVIDMLGRTLVSRSATLPKDENKAVECEGLSSGTYLVVIRGNGTVSTHRIQI